MDENTLFPMDEASGAENPGIPRRGSVRILLPVRDQVEMMMAALDDLVPEDHQVRIVWAFMEQQDLSGLYELIRATEDRPGRTPIDPRLLMALWLNATLDGVGSAREVARRCTEDVASRWLCGGVSVNYHTLSDFRVDHVEVLDDVLTRDVASLMAEGLVELNRVAQDGLAGGEHDRAHCARPRTFGDAQETARVGLCEWTLERVQPR